MYVLCVIAIAIVNCPVISDERQYRNFNKNNNRIAHKRTPGPLKQNVTVSIEISLLTSFEAKIVSSSPLVIVEIHDAMKVFVP